MSTYCLNLAVAIFIYVVLINSSVNPTRTQGGGGGWNPLHPLRFFAQTTPT